MYWNLHFFLAAIGMLLAPGIQVIFLSLLSKIVGKEDTSNIVIHLLNFDYRNDSPFYC